MKRPVVISIICVLGFIGVILTPVALWLSLSVTSTTGQATELPKWYTAQSLVFALIYLYALIQIWRMKRIGIEIYTMAAIIEYAIGFMYGLVSVGGIIVSVVALGIIWVHYKKMTLPTLFRRSIAPLNEVQS